MGYQHRSGTPHGALALGWGWTSALFPGEMQGRQLGTAADTPLWESLTTGGFWLQAAPGTSGTQGVPDAAEGSPWLQQAAEHWGSPSPRFFTAPNPPGTLAHLPWAQGGLASFLLTTGSPRRGSYTPRTDDWTQWVQLCWSLLAWGDMRGRRGGSRGGLGRGLHA